MRTTLVRTTVPEYLGADLTDRYARNCRPIDVCGLTPTASNQLSALFWEWQWDSSEAVLDVSIVANELMAARSTMLDGPQGLAAIGQSLRTCERQSGAVGKTPDTVPILGKPFAGYIRSSLELFSALRQIGLTVSPATFVSGVSEVYPGDIWPRLAKRVLPKKSTTPGRLARKLILEALGVQNLPDLPTHDQNDACVGALLAAVADGKLAGVSVHGLGLPLAVDADGNLREGPMVIPVLANETDEKIQQAITAVTRIVLSRTAKVVSSPSIDGAKERAEALLNRFIQRAREGNAEICAYSWAYRHLFGLPYKKWSQAFANQVLAVAQNTSLAELSGLGAVRLDAFVVAISTGLPSDGHWESANYEREDWERVLGTATLLQ